MTNKIMMGCISFLLCTAIYAESKGESKTFVGLEAGPGKIFNGVTTTLGDISDSDNDTVVYGFRIGAERNEWRSTLLYSYEENDDNNQDISKGMLTVDYFLIDYEHSSARFRPYIGLNAGYAFYQASNEATGSGAIDEAGPLYGAQAGLSIGFSSLDIDLLYRYSSIDISEVDHSESLILGVNYFF